MAEDTNEPVEIAFDDDPGKQATLLLAAAEDLDLDQGEVRTTAGGFLVSQEIAEKAFPKKKAAAKKAAAKDEEKD
jgi:hypothetical protein